MSVLPCGWLPVVLAAFQVTGEPSCPSRNAIEQAVRASLGVTADALDHTAEIRATEGALQIELRDGDGHPLGERRLAAQGSCAQLAEAVAILISAWETELPAQSFALSSSIVPETVAKQAAPSWSWELGLALSDSFSGALLPPGIALSGTLGKGRLRASLSLAADWPAQLTEGPGQIFWNRAALGLGGVYRFEPPWGTVDVEAQALGGLLFLSASNYFRNASATGFDLGLRIGGRFYPWHARLRPWVELAGTGWLQTDHAVVGGLGTFPLPQFLVSAALGVLYEFR